MLILWVCIIVFCIWFYNTVRYGDTENREYRGYNGNNSGYNRYVCPIEDLDVEEMVQHTSYDTTSTPKKNSGSSWGREYYNTNYNHNHGPFSETYCIDNRYERSMWDITYNEHHATTGSDNIWSEYYEE
jgi:hypothetical protein